MWNYRCYDDGRTPSLWQRWYDQNKDKRGTHDSVFRMLEQQKQWTNTVHTKIFDKNNGIIEVRLTGNPKHRILGFYGEAQREFVILGTCTHKQHVYDPPSIRKTVVSRKKEILENKLKAQVCVRPSTA